MSLKIVSLNMWWGGKLMPGILEFLKAEEPDIIALQEVYNADDPLLEDRYRSIETLQNHLPYPHYDFAQSFIHDGPAGKLPQGNAVLSKFPISSTPARFLVEPNRESYKDVPENWPIIPRVLQHVVIETSAAKINFFNMHGVWDTDGDNNSPARQRMSKIILEETRGMANIILTGDTNAQATNPAMRALEASLKPVFGTELKSTFNMRHKTNPGYATAAVDLMYVSPNMQVVSAECPDVDISDHLPIVVTLDIA